MRLVIDANVFFAAFLWERSDIRKLILSHHLELFSPEWLLEEFDRNQDRLMKKMDSKEKFLETKSLLLSFIKVLPQELYASYLPAAEKELKENKKDVPYIAISLFLQAPLWSNDQNLKKKQKLVSVLSVAELFELLEKQNLLH